MKNLYVKNEKMKGSNLPSYSQRAGLVPFFYPKIVIRTTRHSDIFLYNVYQSCYERIDYKLLTIVCFINT